ncbi:ATP-dependent zinc metalloprotease FtsH [Candidatus Parcubacteria bacterium]|nr:ATP-dependent zinc metalloprotease FtsH [Patescibacteria group bacterium]MCG2686976.1 ATP-dependent zinc metalloprotease FtsH [Candidatus Parcubacteria bacterium]
MKNLFKNLFIILMVFIIMAGLFSLYDNPEKDKIEEVGIGQVIEKINNEQVAEITVKGDELEILLRNGQQLKTFKESTESLSTLLDNYNVPTEKSGQINIKVQGKSGFEYWLSGLLPFLIPLFFILGFIFLLSRQAQNINNRAMNFGQTNANEPGKKGEKKEKITFANVAGAKEAKDELIEVVDFLKNSKKFSDVGAKIPKGVLLLGPPGTGKTLMARAVSGEAGVPFFHVSGSEFVEMFVGVGASRVRSLFQKAKKNAPCIVFIDELDAIGRQRGAGLGGSHDEREQTLNQILVEMDGFEPNSGVIVLAATNRPDVLDAALLRPGRFDRRVTFDLPDLNERLEILKIHATDKPLAKETDLKRVAERTPGFSGADLANLMNEAAILTAKNNKKKIKMPEIFESIEKVMLGPERKSRVLLDKEKEITAYHEAGHALVAHESEHSDPVQKVSIIARGQASGYTLKVPERDAHMHSKSYFLAEMAVLLAGHATEKEIFKEVTTGATSDLRRATKIARKLVTEYGMSDKMGPRTFGGKEELVFLGREISEQKDYSEKTAELIDQEVSDLLAGAYDTAYGIIIKEKDTLKRIVDKLMEKETLEKEEFENIVNNN